MRFRGLVHRAHGPQWPWAPLSGEGATAVSEETIQIAVQMINGFPHNISSPDIEATPHGEVDFDWTTNAGAMLTISVGPDGEIATALSLDGSRLRGSEPWSGSVPPFARFCRRQFADASMVG